MAFKKLAVFAASAFTAAAIATSTFAQEVTLRFHHFLPPQANVPKQVIGKWADDVAKATQGKVKVDVYPSMQLGGKPPQLMDQARDGIVDLVWTVVGYTPGRFPRTEVFELPFMMTNAGAASRAYWQMFEKHMADTEFKDLKIIGTWVHGPGLFHSKKPIASVSDLRGVKIRGGSRTVNSLLVELGATPVGMPVPAVPEALSKGVIDATTIPWEVTAALKVPELVSNHTEFGKDSLYTLTFVIAMNKAKFDSLPDDIKKAIDSVSGEEFSVYAGSTQEAADGPARELAVKRNNNIIQLNEEQIAEWKKAAEPIYAKWVADMKEKGIDGQALIDEARGLIAKYTK
ncbi:MAG: TRAP transporter substrate-binding protein [Pseudomonadota bacterium]